MEIETRRRHGFTNRTPGDVYVDGRFAVYSLEDPVREVEGQPVSAWKIAGDTAIGRGRYRVTLENSPRFGPETITINGVEGFSFIRAHGGLDETATEGCCLLGVAVAADGKIPPGMSAPGVSILKRIIREALDAGEDVFWTFI